MKIFFSPEDGHIYCILLIRIVFCHVSSNLPLHCLFCVSMEIYFCFYFNNVRDVGTILPVFVNIYHFTYTLLPWHAHTVVTVTHTYSTVPYCAHNVDGDNQAQEPGWEGWRKGFWSETKALHTHKKGGKQCQHTNHDISNLRKIRTNGASAKLLDYFLWSNKSIINQIGIGGRMA